MTQLVRAGRPVLVAQIKDNGMEIIEVYRKFHELIRQLSYAEKVAVANGLYLSLATVQGWCYSRRGTSLDNRLKVLAWDKAGRPMTKRKQSGEISLFDI